MTLEQVRKRLLRVCKPYTSKDGRGFGLKAWCRANGVASTHASDFLAGKRNPANDLLEALGLEWRVMPKRKLDEDHYLSNGWVHFNPTKSTLADMTKDHNTK